MFISSKSLILPFWKRRSVRVGLRQQQQRGEKVDYKKSLQGCTLSISLPPSFISVTFWDALSTSIILLLLAVSESVRF